MKFNKFLFGAAALSMGVFASCSSDEPVKGPEGGNINKDGSNYIAVRISTAGLNSSRAIADGGYQEGSEAENSVTKENTRFYFFDASGNAFSMKDAVNVNGTVANKVTNMVAPTDIAPGNTNGNTSATLNGVLILGTAANSYQGVVPSQAVCVVNLTTAQFEALENKSFTELAEITNNMSADVFVQDAFVMSSSNYDGAPTLGATDIISKVYATATDAESNPADFWIERLAVKVQFEKNQETSFDVLDTDGITPLSLDVYQLDGSKVPTTFKVTLDGWQLVNRADKAYIFKNLPTGLDWDWSNAQYHRSFWAVNPTNVAFETASTTFDILAETKWGAIENAQYTYEYTDNATTVTKASERGKDVTGLAIRATICDNNGKPFQLVRFAGVSYTRAAFEDMVIRAYLGNNSESKVEDFVVVYEQEEGKNTYAASIKKANPAEGDANTPVAMDRYVKIQLWDGGKTAYYLNIQHFTGTTGPTLYGVVRNHIYEYGVEDVIGLGIPGNEDPNPEETETYVAARLNVLNWKVVSNKVTLE